MNINYFKNKTKFLIAFQRNYIHYYLCNNKKLRFNWKIKLPRYSVCVMISQKLNPFLY